MLSSNAGYFPGVSRGEPGLVRSLVIFGLPLPKVLLFSVVLSEGSGVLGHSVSICGASASVSLSESSMTVRLCFDGDFVNRPSGPLGPFPLLLYSCSKSMGLLIFFRWIIFPFSVVTVCLVPDIANFGLSVYALSNLDRLYFFSENRKV